MKIQQANYQDFLKTLAILTMIIDHVGLYFFPSLLELRIIGRTAAPMFLFFAGYNFRNIARGRLFWLGVLLELNSYLILQHFLVFNILIVIYLGQLYLKLFSKYLHNFYIMYTQVVILGLLWAYTWNILDYGSIAFAIMILGYFAKRHESEHKLLCLGLTIIIMILPTIAFFPLNTNQTIALIIVHAMQYVLMIARPLNSPISYNVSFISRNALSIYFVHLWLIHQLFAFKHQIYNI